MNIFLSHSSRNKPLVREVILHLPSHVHSWIDENEILIGDNIDFSVRKSIDASSDYLLLFVDEFAAKSKWVKKELEWALKKENSIGRPFVLPVVLDERAWQSLIPQNMQSRRYITCENYSKLGVRELAERLVSELFARLSKDLDHARESKKTSQAVGLLDQADEYLREVADIIRVAVYPHRKENPITITELYDTLRSQAAFDINSVRQFEELIGRLRQRGLLAGIVCFGDDLFVEEEHYAWKTTMRRSQKRRIASRAMKFIDSNSTIALDAGSTTLEIAKQIGRSVKMQLLNGLKVVTNSVPAANYLLNTASELGLEDENQILNIYIAGGRIRSNTLAIVSDEGMTDSSGEHDLVTTIRRLGSADVAFVGTNGISKEKGFTTHVERECKTKQAMLQEADQRFVVSDPSKFGISETFSFASFDDVINVITVKNNEDTIVNRYIDIMNDEKSSIILA